MTLAAPQNKEGAMPFDETSRRPGRQPSRNVLGGTLDICSTRPMTGFFRNGCCDTSAEDFGSHTVCAVMTAEFLAFSKAAGNDLSTPQARIRLRRTEAGRSLVPVRAPLAGGIGRQRRAACRAARDAGGRAGPLCAGRPEEIRRRSGLRRGGRTSRGIRADRATFPAARRSGRARTAGRRRGAGAAARSRTGADLRCDGGRRAFPA